MESVKQITLYSKVGFCNSLNGLNRQDGILPAITVLSWVLSLLVFSTELCLSNPLNVLTA